VHPVALVEVQCSGDAVEDVLGSSTNVCAFESHVILGADSASIAISAAKPLHSPVGAVGGQSRLPGCGRSSSQAPGDVRLERRDDPSIIEPTDAIIRLSATCICGSDLWPYRQIDPGKVFDLTLPLDRVADGYRAMGKRRAIKTLLTL
jgi:hypothetical protein